MAREEIKDIVREVIREELKIDVLDISRKYDNCYDYVVRLYLNDYLISQGKEHICIPD